MSIDELKNELGQYAAMKEQHRLIGEGLAEMRDESERLRKRQQELGCTLAFLEGLTSGITNDTRRRAVEGRYMKGKSNEELGEEMCYSARQIQRIITEAIEELTT